MTLLRDAALEYLDSGLCVLPAERHGDRKRVALPEWKRYQSALPQNEDVERWFASASDGGALCVVCGAVSGNLEMIDFDLAGEAFEPWRALVERDAPGLVGRMFIESTPSGGKHVAYRCECEAGRSVKLAHRLLEVGGPEEVTVGSKTLKPRQDAQGRWIVTPTLIETRGEAGLFLCAPSEGYEALRGSLCRLPTVTAAERETMLAHARVLDELPQATAAPPVASTPTAAPRVTVGTSLEERAALYLARMPEAVSGQGGHNATFAAATALVHGFGIEPDRALAMLLRDYNPRCLPPWSERELRHKVDQARSTAHARPFGWLRDAERADAAPAGPRADLGGIMAEGERALHSDGSVPPRRPFPVHTFPEPFATYIAESAAAIDCDPCMVGVPLLPVLASAIGNTRRIELKSSWVEPCIIWALVAADSGMAKNPALRAASCFARDRQNRMVREHEEARRKYVTDCAVHEKAFSAWRRTSKASDGQEPGSLPPVEPVAPVMPCAWTSDATVEAVGKLMHQNPRGVLMLQDELKAFLSFDTYKSTKGGDGPRWLGMFGGDQIRIDRKTSEPLLVRHAALSVAGMIQPAILARAMTRESKESGLAARFLMAMPEWRVKRWNENTVPPDTISHAQAAYDALCALQFTRDKNGEEAPQSVTLSEEARQLWREFAHEHADEHEAIGPGSDLTAAWSKYEGYTARIALVFAMVRDACKERKPLFPTVDARSLADAIELVRWFEDEARRIYPALARGGNPEPAVEPVVSEAEELQAWLRGRGGSATARDLTHSLRRYRGNPEAAEAALGRLVTAGLGVWEYPPPGAQGGRPRKVVRLTGSQVPPIPPPED